MTQSETPPRARLYAGGAVFVLGFCSPLLIPLVMQTGLSDELKTAISGLLMFGVPELGMLVAVAILGKPGYQYLKSRILGSLAELLFPARVGPVRHGLGVTLFLVPFIVGWLQPYFLESMLDEAGRFTLAVAGDVMLLIGLLLLGGEFWEKLHRLFTITQQEPEAQ